MKKNIKFFYNCVILFTQDILYSNDYVNTIGLINNYSFIK